MSAVDDLTSASMRELTSMLLDEQLGGGIGRMVYALMTDPSKVVKVEQAAGSFQNIHEWQVWDALQDTKWAKYLAPCHHISPNGSVLIMSRVLPLRSLALDKSVGADARLQDIYVPGFLTDIKRENFGWLNGRIVACDYGYTRLLSMSGNMGRLRKVDWHA